jgi:TetR/AcrR family tetracycline transcriptional repressor
MDTGKSPGRTQAGRLTPESITAEALLLLNESGLEGVSLRRLALRLGIKAPSLYWHFADKSALQAAIIEKIFHEALDSIPPHREWQAWMRAFGEAMWRTQRDTRDFNRLVATTPLRDEQLGRTMGRLRAAVAGLDMEEAEAMRIQSGIQALVLGWSTFAHAPYADRLGQLLDFDQNVRENLELLLAGEAQKLGIARAADGFDSPAHHP